MRPFPTWVWVLFGLVLLLVLLMLLGHPVKIS